MPDWPIHLNQARHNETCYSSIDIIAFGDWAMTVLFYAALHYIDAWLDYYAGLSDPGGHDIRDAQLRSQSMLREIYPQYSRLKNRSRNARYFAVRFSGDEVSRAETEDLAVIRTRIVSQLP